MKNLEQFKCGECGEENHKIYLRKDGNIIVECIKCKSSSILYPTEPKILIRNHSGDGSLCVYPD